MIYYCSVAIKLHIDKIYVKFSKLIKNAAQLIPSTFNQINSVKMIKSIKYNKTNHRPFTFLSSSVDFYVSTNIVC